MRLAGDLAEVALSDFLQIQAAGRRTCAVKVVGTATSGAIYLENGRAVHAQCSGLEGEDAFVVLIAQAVGYFQADRDVVAPKHSLEGPLDRLMLLAQSRIQSGALPAVPRPIAPLVPQPPPAVRQLQAVAERPGPPTRAQARALPFAVGALLVLMGGASVALWHSFGGDQKKQGPPAPMSPVAAAGLGGESPLESTNLAVGDVPPVLVAGKSPPSPDPNFALQPTIVCRVLVGVDGAVEAAAVYRSRVELSIFEEAALAAVRDYRFEPARQGTKPVRVWTNVPVRFDP